MQQYGTTGKANNSIAWKQGAMVGVGIGVLYILYVLLATFAGIDLGLVNMLVWLVGFFLAGMFTAQHTGTIGSAAMGGLFAAVVGGAIAFIVNCIMFFTRPDFIQTYNTAGLSNEMMAGIGIVVFLIMFLLGLGIGAGVGAVGGLLGKNRYGRHSTDMPGTPTY